MRKRRYESFTHHLLELLALNDSLNQPGHHGHRPDRHGPDSKGPGSYRPREFLDDEFDFGLERREFFIEDLTTRELIDELTDRLERRGNVGSKIKEAVKPKKYG